MSGDTEHYKALFRDIPVMLAIIGLDGSVREVNPYWLEYTGFSEEELAGKAWVDFVHTEDVPTLKSAQEKLLAGSKSAQVEGRIRCRDGSYKWVLISGSLDAATGTLWTSASDITARRAAEESCRESENYLRTILDSAAIPMAVVSSAGVIEYINNKVTETFGYTLSDMPDMEHWWPLAYPDENTRRESKERWMASVRQALENGGEIPGGEYLITCKDGSARNCYFFGTIISGKALVMLEDITARVKAQEALQASEHLLRRIIDKSPISMAIVGFDERIEYINAKAEETFGYPNSEIPTMSDWWRLAYPDEAYRKEVMSDWMGRVMDAVNRNAEIIGSEYEVTCKDGTKKTCFISGTIAAGKVFVMFDDITERVRAREALLRVIEEAPVAISVSSQDGKLEMLNRKFTKTFGYVLQDIPDLETMAPMVYPDPDYRREVLDYWAGLQASPPKEGEELPQRQFRVRCKDGSDKVVVSATVTTADKKIITINNDVTQQVKAQAQIQESERKLADILQQAPIAISVSNPEGVFELVNRKFTEYFGYTMEDISNMDRWMELACPDEAYRRELHSLLSRELRALPKTGGEMGYLTARITCRDGSVKHVAMKGLVSPNGQIVTMMEDITATVAAEKVLKDSEAAMRETLENAPIPIILHDLEKTYYINKRFRESFGYSLEEIANFQTWLKLAYPDQNYRDGLTAKAVPLFEAAKKGDGVVPPIECHITRKDGKVRKTRITTQVLSSGKLIASVEDLTDILAAQQALQESEHKLRQILESAPVPILLHDLERTHFINRKFTDTLGYSLEDILYSRDAFARLYPDEAYRAEIREGFASRYEQAVRGNGFLRPLEARVHAKDGTVRAMRLSAHIVANGQVVSIMEDLTEQITVQQVLRASEKNLRRIIEQAPVAMVMHTLDGKFHIFNKKLQQITGYTLKDVPDLDTWTRRVYPDENYRKELLKFWSEQIERSGRTGQEMDPIDVRLVCKDGSVKQVTVAGIVTPDKSVIVAMEDITQRRETERALRESESLYRSLIETTGTGYVVIDGQGKVLDANVEYVRLSGHSDLKELIGRSVLDWAAPYDKVRAQEAIAKTVRDGAISAFEVDHKGRDGKVTPVEISATVVQRGGIPRIISLARDITVRRQRTEELKAFSQQMEKLVEKRTGELRRANEELTMEIAQRMDAERSREKLQQDLLQAQKMELVGLLASGITHDFNNILVTISATAEVLLKTLAPDSPVRNDIEEIMAETERGTLLTRQLGGISRKKPVAPRRLDINAIVSDTLDMLKKLMGTEVRLSTDLSAELPAVKADEGQMVQVMMNLVINARDAMPEGGKVTVTTAPETLKSAPPDMHLPAKPGRYATISVADTGTGIGADAIKRIFDPFFTTKAVGKGTGLGLSIVYGIVSKAGGGILVRTAPGGTTFKIYLPEEKGA